MQYFYILQKNHKLGYKPCNEKWSQEEFVNAFIKFSKSAACDLLKFQWKPKLQNNIRLILKHISNLNFVKFYFTLLVISNIKSRARIFRIEVPRAKFINNWNIKTLASLQTEKSLFIVFLITYIPKIFKNRQFLKENTLFQKGRKTYGTIVLLT